MPRRSSNVLRLQDDIGCDIVTDGELRRDNFYSFVADKLEGVQLMTLAEMLDVVEDKAGFEQFLQTLDVPGVFDQQPGLFRNESRVAHHSRSTSVQLAKAPYGIDRSK